MPSTLLVIIAIGSILAVVGALAAFTTWNTLRAQRLVPRDGKILEVPGGRLHFVDHGQGSPIVLIHGLGGQLRNLTCDLSHRLAINHRVIAVDRPGSGYSQFTDAADHGLRTQAEMIVALIKSVGIRQPLLVGHSLGGAVALAAAAAHPEEIGGLALLAPLTQPVDRVPKVFAALDIRSKLLRLMVAGLLAAPVGRLQAGAVGKELFGPEEPPGDFEARCGAALSLRPSAFIAASEDLQACKAEMPEIAATYHGIRAPVGILFANEDRILNPQLHGVAVARSFSEGTVTLIEGGHMFPITQAQRTAEWIEDRAAAMT